MNTLILILVTLGNTLVKLGNKLVALGNKVEALPVYVQYSGEPMVEVTIWDHDLVTGRDANGYDDQWDYPLGSLLIPEVVANEPELCQSFIRQYMDLGDTHHWEAKSTLSGAWITTSEL